MPHNPAIPPGGGELSQTVNKLGQVGDIANRRTVEVSREHGLARAREMTVGIDKTGHQGPPPEIHN